MHKDLVVNLMTGQDLLPKCCSFKLTNQLEPRSYHLHLKHYYQKTQIVRTGSLASAAVKCNSVLPGIESEAMQDVC